MTFAADLAKAASNFVTQLIVGLARCSTSVQLHGRFDVHHATA
jgi:hypothetical protein